MTQAEPSTLSPAELAQLQQWTDEATALLQSGQPAAALPLFQRVAQLAPTSADAHNNLGVTYWLLGDAAQSEAAYRQGIAADPQHAQTWKNLAVLLLQVGKMQEGVQILVALVQSNPNDPEALFLMGKCYETGEDYASARTMWERALQLAPDFALAAQALAGLPRAEPALIAKPEHARKLAALKGLKKPAPAETPAEAVAPAPAAQPASVLVYGAGDFADARRSAGLLHALQSLGHPARASSQPALADLDAHQVFILRWSQAAARLLGLMEAAAAQGKAVIVDLDESCAEPSAELQKALALATLVTAASPALAQQAAPLAKRVLLAPTAPDSANPLWAKPAPRRQKLHLGLWTPRFVKADLAPLKDALIKLVRGREDVLLAVGGDYTAYEFFAGLPEPRRLFLPPVPYEDFPYLLAQFDLLLWPLADAPANAVLSDALLAEAGARRLPWLASPRPAALQWACGGLTLSDRPADWIAAISQLLDNPAERARLGAEGREKFAARTAEAQAAWKQALDALL